LSTLHNYAPWSTSSTCTTPHGARSTHSTQHGGAINPSARGLAIFAAVLAAFGVLYLSRAHGLFSPLMVLAPFVAAAGACLATIWQKAGRYAPGQSCVVAGVVACVGWCEYLEAAAILAMAEATSELLGVFFLTCICLSVIAAMLCIREVRNAKSGVDVE
jgi:hypothetical protein